MPGLIDPPHAAFAQLLQKHVVIQHRTFAAAVQKLGGLITGQLALLQKFLSKLTSIAWTGGSVSGELADFGGGSATRFP
jgi:hypothetical protein